MAWGQLTYTRPLTEKQASDYELRPAKVHLDMRREQPAKRPISDQLREAEKQAEKHRGPAAPKKESPDRGDR